MTDRIETYIYDNLFGDARRTALDLVKYLGSVGLTFHKDNDGYWKNKIYYHIKCADERVCFISINNPDEPENFWTIWSDDSSAYEDESISDEIKNAGWKYVDHCANCGSCGGGKRKVIFGKSFDRVCGCTFRIDNPDMKDLHFVKTMVDLRVKEISERKSVIK